MTAGRVAEMQKGCRQWDELDENSEGMMLMYMHMVHQLSGPLESSVHLHCRWEEKVRRKYAYILRVSPRRDARLP
jgi:hypothetical protein